MFQIFLKFLLMFSLLFCQSASLTPTNRSFQENIDALAVKDDFTKVFPDLFPENTNNLRNHFFFFI